jgi:hypothetical protein
VKKLQLKLKCIKKQFLLVSTKINFRKVKVKKYEKNNNGEWKKDLQFI